MPPRHPTTPQPGCRATPHTAAQLPRLSKQVRSLTLTLQAALCRLTAQPPNRPAPNAGGPRCPPAATLSRPLPATLALTLTLTLDNKGGGSGGGGRVQQW
jgi:hypothetical protein